jgi:hypothetical protein
MDLYIHSPIRLCGVMLLVKHRHNFTFIILCRIFWCQELAVLMTSLWSELYHHRIIVIRCLFKSVPATGLFHLKMLTSEKCVNI